MNNPENNPNSCVSSNIGFQSQVEALAKFAPLVKSRALSFTSNENELDDLIQEGSIGLLSAYKRYDSSLSGFVTFARRCIDAAIIDYLRKSSKLSRVPESLLIDFNDVQVADSAIDPEYALSIKEEYLGIVKKAEEVLSEMEYTVFNGLLHGYSNSEIAELHSLQPKSVNNAVSRIRAKLK